VVYAIGPTYYQSAWYAPIVDPTGGKFFDITGNFRDILLDISRGRANGRFMLSYRTSAAPSGQRQVKVEVHAAGLGGFATAMYTAPGGAPVLAHGLQCYPNPFNPRVTIRVDLRGQSRAEVTVYTLLGQRVRTFLVGPSSGVSEVSWDGNDSSGRRVASGVFLVRSTVFGPRDEILGTDLLKLVHVQ
jgi:hypothetical protein